MFTVKAERAVAFPVRSIRTAAMKPRVDQILDIINRIHMPSQGYGIKKFFVFLILNLTLYSIKRARFIYFCAQLNIYKLQSCSTRVYKLL